MRDRIYLVANQVVEAVCCVGVDETVPYPLSSPHRLVDVGHDLKGGFDAILIAGTFSQGVIVGLAREAEDVVGVFAGKGNELATFGPVDLR